MSWIKKGSYYAVNGAYTMSWNDPKDRFTLYFRREHLVSGSREECLDKFYTHFKLPAEMKVMPSSQTTEQWLDDYNREYEEKKNARQPD